MKILHSSLSWLVTLLVPLALVFLAVRLLLTPVFLEMEYRLPGFPPDSYGFTRDDRRHYSRSALQYLLNEADISFLGDLTFPDGAPLYSGRELSHMLDVKKVVQPALWTGGGVWAALLGLGIWAWRGRWGAAYRAGLRRGGWLMVGLAAAIGIFAAVSFWQFFTVFHALFFEGDSWLFYYSDTLIRLFPLRFWQDAFIIVGVISVGGGLGLALGIKSVLHEG